MNQASSGAVGISRNTVSTAGVLAAVATVVIILNVLFQFMISWPSEDLRDFGSFWESGRAALEGRNPYEIHDLSYRVEIKHFSGANPNLNPPASLLIMAPVSLLDPHAAFLAVWWGSLAAYIAGLFYLVRRYRPPGGKWLFFWALSLPGFWGTLFLGQIYVPLAIAAGAAWILQDRGRFIWAGILIGLIAAFKPNFLVWPVLLLIAGHWRIAVPAVLSIATLSVAPILFFGAGVYAQWFEMLAGDDPGRILWVTNMSVIAYAGRLEFPWLGKLAAAVLLLGIAWWAWRRRPGPRDAGLVALFASLLASPVAWIHYALFLLPALFSVRWSRYMVTGAVLLAVPRLIADSLFAGPTWMEVTLGSVYIWGLLLLAVPAVWPLVARGSTPFSAEAPAHGRTQPA